VVLLQKKLFYSLITKDKIMLRQTFDIKDYLGNSGARIPELVNYLGDKYNYNPGSLPTI
jgi:hypothetical protein